MGQGAWGDVEGARENNSSEGSEVFITVLFCLRGVTLSIYIVRDMLTGGNMYVMCSPYSCSQLVKRLFFVVFIPSLFLYVLCF